MHTCITLSNTADNAISTSNSPPLLSRRRILFCGGTESSERTGRADSPRRPVVSPPKNRIAAEMVGRLRGGGSGVLPSDQSARAATPPFFLRPLSIHQTNHKPTDRPTNQPITFTRLPSQFDSIHDSSSLTCHRPPGPPLPIPNDGLALPSLARSLPLRDLDDEPLTHLPPTHSFFHGR